MLQSIVWFAVDVMSCPHLTRTVSQRCSATSSEWQVTRKVVSSATQLRQVVGQLRGGLWFFRHPLWCFWRDIVLLILPILLWNGKSRRKRLNINPNPRKWWFTCMGLILLLPSTWYLWQDDLMESSQPNLRVTITGLCLAKELRSAG